MRLYGVDCDCGGHAMVVCANGCPKPDWQRTEETQRMGAPGSTRPRKRAAPVDRTREDRSAQTGGEPERDRRGVPAPIAEKACKGCGVMFRPESGHQLYCGLDCPVAAVRPPRQPRPANLPRSVLLFRDKPCADCRQMFTPTGGRSVRCPACKQKATLP